jgi:putative transposase
LPSRQKKGWIDPNDELLSLNAQLALSGLSKASYYYEPVPETAWNLELMAMIDKLYTDYPFYGSRRMRAELRERGHEVNRKRVVRLMQKMGLQAIYPKKNLSKAAEHHIKYPYLLKDLTIDRPDQVWATDITYIRVGGGYLYLTAVMDWHTRFVLSWKISNTLDVGFCMEALEEALKIGKPEIFNSDQGCQYTSKDFTEALKVQGIQISMDGKGRAYDNIFVERLWRSVKYEEVYLKRYETGKEAVDGLNRYLTFYNDKRLHQALGYKTPRSWYTAEQRKVQ